MKSIILSSAEIASLLNSCQSQFTLEIFPKPAHQLQLFPSSLTKLQLWRECENGRDINGHSYIAPFSIGEKLWVKESYAQSPANALVYYAADSDKPVVLAGLPWIPAVQMQAKHARLFVVIKSYKAVCINGEWSWIYRVESTAMPYWWQSSYAI